MCCPPAPLARKVSTRISFSSITTSSSAFLMTGVTTTPAKLVCRRFFALNGDCRTKRCVPFTSKKTIRIRTANFEKSTFIPASCPSVFSWISEENSFSQQNEDTYEEAFCPVLCFGSPRTCINFENGIRVIKFSRKEKIKLRFFVFSLSDSYSRTISWNSEVSSETISVNSRRQSYPFEVLPIVLLFLQVLQQIAEDHVFFWIFP